MLFRGCFFEKRREILRNQIKELKETLAFLEYKCWYYETATAAGTEAMPKETPSEQISLKYRKARKRLEIDSKKSKKRKCEFAKKSHKKARQMECLAFFL